MTGISEIFKQIEGLGNDLYVFGGALRDALLQARFKDFDLAVPHSKLKEYTDRLSQIFELKYRGEHGSLVVYRFYDRKSGITIDVQSYDELERFLKHRDFSINSLAVGVSDAPGFFTAPEKAKALIIDVNAGLDDLQKKVVRHCYDRVFEDDPVRIIRAARFAAGFNFIIAAETVVLAREKSSLIRKEKPARMVDEIRKGLRSNAAGFVEELINTGADAWLMDGNREEAIEAALKSMRIRKSVSFSRKEAVLFDIATMISCGFNRQIVNEEVFSKKDIKYVYQIFKSTRKAAADRICEIIAESSRPALVAAVLCFQGYIEPEEIRKVERLVQHVKKEAGRQAEKAGVPYVASRGRFIREQLARQICEKLSIKENL